ncbi:MULTISPECIES: hypothetical protein [unclassified Citrobacter]|uniref:hypothetical protein n=1 Tax=unclassified Citrobacter TaxID=2644389 RepID=UPI001B3630B4|nr:MULTISPECIES: hypothetical protein [unclassified Citrobacter]MBP8542004.1 hypothetical protein [Citrobacter sp. On2M]MBP8543488.1 hypothetical protein [Citrobacter sp. On2M]MBW5274233.1 hypothetical protein [Citrobacter sp. On28M]
MTKKFEEMPFDVQESILRTIEWRLTHGCSGDDGKDVDSVMAAYCRLFESNSTTKVGEVVVNITTVNGNT